MIAALYVEPDGVYSTIDDVELWPLERDARHYAGPWPVVAHPPCGSWGPLANVNHARWGSPIDEDGGCFQAALEAVQRWGGVLEHPAFSRAWAAYGLSRPIGPLGYWLPAFDGGFVAQISQAAYGHPARKLTWLVYYGERPPAFDLLTSSPPARAIVSACANSKTRDLPRIMKKEAAATPPALAIVLVGLAHHSREATPLALSC